MAKLNTDWRRKEREKVMDRKAVARETLNIMEQGYYDAEDGGGAKKRIYIRDHMERSVRRSILITPEKGGELLRRYESKDLGEERENAARTMCRVEHISTVDAVRKLALEGRENIGVLNFASAKNPGGGFINGAMAQEESLAASGTLYRTLTANEAYYRENRACQTMMYTDYGIYSPDVMFFRDGRFRLTPEPVKASVLTMPAVNMGQVVRKGEDVHEAERVMRRRMKLVLAVFADQGAANLVLGAYGCGVFQNDPEKVAQWWKEILEEGFEGCFLSVFYAVYDRSKGQKCLEAFERVFDL